MSNKYNSIFLNSKPHISLLQMVLFYVPFISFKVLFVQDGENKFFRIKSNYYIVIRMLLRNYLLWNNCLIFKVPYLTFIYKRNNICL
jgi:hypothetical protein